jgi:hypothetical protein
MKMHAIRLTLCIWALVASAQVFAQDNIAELAVKLEKRVEKNGFQMTVNATSDVVAMAIEKNENAWRTLRRPQRHLHG